MVNPEATWFQGLPGLAAENMVTEFKEYRSQSQKVIDVNSITSFSCFSMHFGHCNSLNKTSLIINKAGYKRNHHVCWALGLPFNISGNAVFMRILLAQMIHRTSIYRALLEKYLSSFPLPNLKYLSNADEFSTSATLAWAYQPTNFSWWLEHS